MQSVLQGLGKKQKKKEAVSGFMHPHKTGNIHSHPNIHASMPSTRANLYIHLTHTPHLL